jgi:tripartite-type tricarboxylate transporter receptor subunit TctC
MTALAAAFGAPAASAQDHRVVTIIVPYPAGGIGDILPRAMADVLAKQTGQTFVVDNKPGATQMIGARLAANAKPDGATIFFGSVTSLAINPSVKKELPYDPVRDFEPIALTFVSPQYLITRRGLAPNSMRELVDLAKREPGKLNYASIGPGSSVHLAAELLKIVAGIDMTHVPYSGSGPAVRDTIAGHVDLTFTAGGMTYADQAKVLGVTSAKRSSAAPQVPAIAETVPGYVLVYWLAVFAPAGTPQPIRKTLADAITEALKDPATAKAMTQGRMEISPLPLDQFAAYVKEQTTWWTTEIKAAGIEPE